MLKKKNIAGINVMPINMIKYSIMISSIVDIRRIQSAKPMFSVCYYVKLITIGVCHSN